MTGRMGYSDVHASGQGTQKETMFLFNCFHFFMLCRNRGDVETNISTSIQM
jgi:hypothetical protein